MKMFGTLLLAILMSIATISCGTRKATVSETHDVRLDIQANELSETVALFRTVDSLGTRLRRELIYKITTMSPPDSSGRQYPVSIEEGTLTEDFEAQSLSKVDSGTVVKVERDTVMHLVGRSVIQSKVETDSRPFRVPWWVWVVGLGIVIVGIVIGVARVKKPP